MSGGTGSMERSEEEANSTSPAPCCCCCSSSSITTAVGDRDENLVKEASRLLELARELQSSASVLIARTWSEEKALRHRAASLDSDLRRLQVTVARKSRKADVRIADKLDEELCRARSFINDGDVASLLPNRSDGALSSGFLRAFLGPLDVRATRKDVRLKVKEEYNNYRDRTAFLFFIFPIILLFSRSWLWNGCFQPLAVQLYQAWLLFLYTSLALRENILRLNGSDIRPWWIYHHYCAMLMALVSLTWEIKGQPYCFNRQRGVELFLYWAMMQGIAMLLQNRYQRKRLYTRIALGKARRMDVVWGETAAVEGQLLLLCPILITLQGFEAYVGLLLLKTALNGVAAEWQEAWVSLWSWFMVFTMPQSNVVVCGVLLVMMAIGNFAITVETLMAKSRFKAKMKRSKSKLEFDPNTSPGNLKSSKIL